MPELTYVTPVSASCFGPRWLSFVPSPISPALNTIVTTKPASVPVSRLPRGRNARHDAPLAWRERPEAPAPGVRSRSGSAPAPAPARAPSIARGWGDPTEIPETSPYRDLVIAYGSNSGANKDLAGTFAERSHFHGYTADVITLNELVQSPPRTQPWLLVVMTSTYTSTPPSNAAAFKSSLERAEPGEQTWQNCRYLVWGRGNTQWNAFLAFPHYVHKRLSDLVATPLAEFAYGDLGSPVWGRVHADWNTHVWPVLLQVGGARPTKAAAARLAAEKAAAGTLMGADSTTAMHKSLRSDDIPDRPPRRPLTASSVMRRVSSAAFRQPASMSGDSPRTAGDSRTQPRVFLAPTILTNAAW